MTDHIPFFSDMPVAALKAATKLWDAARAPRYNGQLSYNDFVADLERIRISAPPRAIVKRWTAGVQAGLVDRPKMADAEPASQAPSLSYFEHLPEAAGAALQAAWDKADAGEFSPKKIFEAFCRDMNTLSHPGPDWREFDAWAKGVKKGEIERPARQIASEAVADLGELTATLDVAAAEAYNPLAKGAIERKVQIAFSGAGGIVPVADSPTSVQDEFSPLTPQSFANLSKAPSTGGAYPIMSEPVLVTPMTGAIDALSAPLRNIRDEMVKATVDRLQVDLQRAAEQIVARQLRQMADEMSGRAA